MMNSTAAVMPRLLSQDAFVILVLLLIATSILRNKFQALSVCAHSTSTYQLDESFPANDDKVT